MLEIAKMYMTLMPVIFAGIANMVWCKSSFLISFYRPMDFGHSWQDGRRIFGDNKTWKGFSGMIVFTASFQLLWGFFLSLSSNLENLTYLEAYNSPLFNLLIGALLGLTYMVCELPNSFIKRRLAILPGKEASNHWRLCFVWIDQIDSLIGCIALIALLAPMSLPHYLFYVFLGGLTHIVINRCLYALKLRRNRF